MKKIILPLFFIFSIISLSLSSKTYAQTPEDLGWKLAIQCYSFKNFTFIEALEKAEKLGIKYVEGYRGQTIGGEYEGTTHYAADKKTIKLLKKLLKAKGIKMINYGVVKGQDRAEWIQIFEFAKAMKIETLTVEPKVEHFKFLPEMAAKYKINLAVHNHPKPSYYWSPEVVLETIEGKNKYIGACADVGHWVRSGLDPVECLKKLEGKIISLHFKDLNKKARKAHDVPWGTGISNVESMLTELKRQGFEGVFSIEYEHNWDNSVPEIAESIANFKKIISEL